jgi:hypothetical protein
MALRLRLRMAVVCPSSSTGPGGFFTKEVGDFAIVEKTKASLGSGRAGSLSSGQTRGLGFEVAAGSNWRLLVDRVGG